MEVTMDNQLRKMCFTIMFVETNILINSIL